MTLCVCCLVPPCPRLLQYHSIIIELIINRFPVGREIFKNKILDRCGLMFSVKGAQAKLSGDTRLLFYSATDGSHILSIFYFRKSLVSSKRKYRWKQLTVRQLQYQTTALYHIYLKIGLNTEYRTLTRFEPFSSCQNSVVISCARILRKRPCKTSGLWRVGSF